MAMSLVVGLHLAASEPTLVYLVRHAEKVDSSRDADLSAQGLKRAEALKVFFEKTSFSAIYATQYQRTQKTVKPVADSKGLPVVALDAGDPKALVSKIHSSPGQIILASGHSNTVPQLISLLGGPEIKIPDDAYDYLFLLVLQDGHCVFQQFLFKP